MNRTLTIGMLITALAQTPVYAATPTCSIHPAKDATDAQLAGLAKVKQPEAEKERLRMSSRLRKLSARNFKWKAAACSGHSS